jgi:membrane-associated phospholipid phosphatase
MTSDIAAGQVRFLGLPVEPRRVASAISIALVPPTISAAVYLALVLEFEHGLPFHRAMVWLTAVLFTGGLQIAYVLYLRKERRVTAYDVPERLQRTGPYLLSVALSIVGGCLLAWMEASNYLLALTWCFAANTALLTLINRFWKISAHMMGLTGPAIFLVPSFGWWTLALLPLVVLLGWARVALRAHTAAQVLAGAMAGIVLTVMQIVVFFRVIMPLLDGAR